MFELTYR